MASYETLRVGLDGPVATLLLHRPDALNALSRAALAEIASAMAALDDRDDVRCVVVRGAGRAFSGGFDLADAAQAAGAAGLRAIALAGRRMAESVRACRHPTIAAVQGRCVGGGLVLMLACDLRVLADDAVLSLPEASLGLPLTWGGLGALVREVGPAVARDLVLTGREVSAAEARSLGLASRVVPPARLLDTTAGLAATLAALPRLVVTDTRTRTQALASGAPDLTAEAEADLLLAAAGDPDCQAALVDRLSGRMPGR